MLTTFQSIIKGRLWVLGDNITTSMIIQGQFLDLDDYDEMAKHTLESLDPKFSRRVDMNDILLCGRNFGSGSSREEAVVVLQKLGIRCVLASSFGRIFYRNAINLGLPVLEVPKSHQIGNMGDLIQVDITKGEILNLDQKTKVKVHPLPKHLLDLLQRGGALQSIKRDKHSK